MQRLKERNFWHRTFSVLVLAPVSLGMILFGYPLNALLSLAISGGIFYEWIKMTRMRLAWRWGGLIYLVVGVTGLNELLLKGNPLFFISLLLTVWMTDISAYVVGLTLGGPKLAPHISPRKTWSGALGGLIFGTLSGIGFFSVIYGGTFSYLRVGCVALGVIVAQAGDLLESWAKRHLGVKDSGTFIPGHGGILDRLDSLLAIGFVIGLYTLFFNLPLAWEKISLIYKS